MITLFFLQALTENIYVIVVCILNKIPVFVVGKPGTSKTLALQVYHGYRISNTTGLISSFFA